MLKSLAGVSSITSNESNRRCYIITLHYGSEILSLPYILLYRIALDGTVLTKLGADVFIGLNDLKYFNKADHNGMLYISVFAYSRGHIFSSARMVV